eukprot:564302-Pleurochrysis_carterae.AAC.1
MRASRLSTRPESCEGVGVATEVEGAVFGAVFAHAAEAGAGGGSAADIGMPGPNGCKRACKSLIGTYGRRPLLDWMCAKCSCIAKVMERSASHKMRYTRSHAAGAPSRAKCAGHCPGRAAGDAS